MKKHIFKALSVILCLCIVLSSGIFASGAEEKTIQYGSYPQTRITDEELISALSTYRADYKSYNYRSGDTTVGSAAPGNFMQYADVFHNGEKYRAVKISAFRPYFSYYPAGTEYSYQKTNGYEAGKTYWFKYEPVTWIIKDTKTGLAVSEKLLDARAFCPGFSYDGNSKVYYSAAHQTTPANDYYYSGLRSWLEKDFFNTAFSVEEAAGLNADNGAKVGILSSENAEKYFETDAERKAAGTDYAACQGLFVSSGCSGWLLKDGESGTYSGSDVKCVKPSGSVGSEKIYCSYNGIRPVIMIDSVIPDYTLTFKTESGDIVYRLREDAPVTLPQNPVKTGYTFKGWDKTVPQTMPAEALEFSPVWEKNSYQIKWNMNGKTVTQSVPYGDSITPPAASAKEGAMFRGWDKTVPAKMPAYALEFNAVYENIVVKSIKITKEPSNTYYVFKSQDKPDLSGIEVEISKSDGSVTKTTDTSLFSVSGLNTRSVGTQKLTVELDGCTAEYEISVGYTWWQQLIRWFLLGFIWYR